MNTPLSVYDFGRQLVETLDLDPVYVMLYNSSLIHEPAKFDRWLLAYWCFYHVGTACWITSQDDYWKAMMTAAKSKEYPRASERRHFRGENAVKSVTFLRDNDTPQAIQFFREDNGTNNWTLDDVMATVRKWQGFGEWIGFKVADMIERLGILSVQFKPSDVFSMFDSPRKGADEMANRYFKGHRNTLAFESCQWAYESLVTSRQLKDLLAPPRFERRLNIQEIETILCKWKSHLNGRYQVGHDIHEVKEGLKRFGRCPLSQKMLVACKQGNLWS